MTSSRSCGLLLGLVFAATGVLFSQNLKPYLQCATDHSIWVNWRSTSGTESTVLWGTTPATLTNTVSGNYHTFAANYLWHGAKITELQANSVYYYKVKTGAEESAVFRFRTYQNPATAQGHIRVLIVGDTQHPTTAQRTFAAAKEKLTEKYGAILEDQVQLILKQGDNVDAGVLSQYTSMHFDPLSNLSGNIPTMTVLGNHEYYQNSDLSYYFPHFEFDDPDIQYNGLAGQNGEHYYAFRVGSVLFCMMNSNEWWASQTNWLGQVVTAANADPSVKWVFGTAHHPLRCENWVSDGSAYVRDQIMPILRASEKSAMYTSGHSHMYARGSSRDSAVWEMISGGGGLIQNWNENVEQDYPDVQRSFDVWTYQIMDIDLEAETMDIECYSIGNEEYVLNNQLIDKFHRYFGKPKPAKPALLTAPNTTLTLPYTFESSTYASPAGELNNSTEFEVTGASGDFENDLILNVKRDFENYYQIESAAYWSPIDQMAGTNIFQLTVDSTQVFQGKNWIRVRHRDRNLEWSAWSDPLPFTADNGKMPLALEPIAWWHFNGDATDATGHGFNGAVPPSGVSFVQDAPIRGQVAQFNNTQSIAVRTGPTASMGQPVVQMTVSGWVKVNAADTWGGFIGCLQDNGSYEKGWVLGTRDQKFSFALMTEGGSAMTYLADTENFTLGQWYYVTATYNGAVMKIFVNGVLKGSSTAQNGDIVYAGLATDWFGIGAYVDENENWLHDGALDELVLWERALSDAEVAALYTGASNLAPQVSITSPAANATYFAPATIAVSADASDQDNNVSLVEFYNGTQKIYEDTDGAPFGFLWENVPAGVHSITAKATDNLGAKSISQPVEVIVLVDMSPMIACPPDVTVETGTAGCLGAHDYTVEFSNGVLNQTGGLPAGDFPLGLTVNQFSVTDTAGNSATCSFSVTVLDRVSPVCTAPADVEIDCDAFDPGLAAYGMPVVSDNCCVDTVTTSVDWSQFDTICHRGAITRTFLASDCSANTNACSQRIVVHYKQGYYIRFPDDVIVTTCPDGLNFGEPAFFGADCALMNVTYQDEVNGLPPDGCYKLERTWRITNGCAFDPTAPLQIVPNPTVSSVIFSPDNLPGPTVSACDALAPWNPSTTKITPHDTVATNYCTFWSPNPNGYLYKQIIRIIDTMPPFISNCLAGPSVFADTTQNDPLLWHDVFEAGQSPRNLTEVPIDLSVTSRDDCSGQNIHVNYLLYLDLDDDGTQETLIHSDFPPPAGTVLYNNINTPNYLVFGTPVSFDTRLVPGNQKWKFAVQKTLGPTEVTASLRWNTALAPNTYVAPQLPPGTHKIVWMSGDGCGNSSSCEKTFTIEPGTGGPAVVCPPDVTVETASSGCAGAYAYTIEYSNGQLEQTAGLASGDFPVGVTFNQFVVTDSLGNTATCAFSVTVEDKTAPVCTPVANVTVSCDQFDPGLSTYGLPVWEDNCCLGAVTTAVSWAQFDTLCQRGTITRLFQASDCNGNGSSCSQRVVVNYAQDYYIHFPDDVITNTCPPDLSFGEPAFFGATCELLGFSYEDVYDGTPVPDACYKLTRTWQVINWCTFNPVSALVEVPNPNPNPITNHPDNLPGPVVSACSALAPWAPTVVKITPTDPDVTNFCSFWSASANGYRYKQRIRILDTTDPVISDCPTDVSVFADSTQNDPALWKNVFNPNLPAQDLTEVETDLSVTSTDDCTGGNTNNRFFLFLDLDNDGTQESVVFSTPVATADTIRYNNANTPGYLGGTPVTFDGRPVPVDQKWHFALQHNTVSGQSTTSLRWNTALAPGVFVVPQLPRGTHKIKWFAADNCGNEAVCEHVFTVLQGATTGVGGLEDADFVLYQNEPNPFARNTTIGFRLPQAAEAVLRVYDVEGRPLFSKKGYYDRGYNTVQLEGDRLSTPGVFYYKLESGAHVAWRKMVRMR